MPPGNEPPKPEMRAPPKTVFDFNHTVLSEALDAGSSFDDDSNNGDVAVNVSPPPTPSYASDEDRPWGAGKEPESSGNRGGRSSKAMLIWSLSMVVVIAAVVGFGVPAHHVLNGAAAVSGGAGAPSERAPADTDGSTSAAAVAAAPSDVDASSAAASQENSDADTDPDYPDKYSEDFDAEEPIDLAETLKFAGVHATNAAGPGHAVKSIQSFYSPQDDVQVKFRDKTARTARHNWIALAKAGSEVNGHLVSDDDIKGWTYACSQDGCDEAELSGEATIKGGAPKGTYQAFLCVWHEDPPYKVRASSEPFVIG